MAAVTFLAATAIGYVASTPFSSPVKDSAHTRVGPRLTPVERESLPITNTLAIDFLRGLESASSLEESRHALKILETNFAGNSFSILDVRKFDETLIGPDGVMGAALLDVAWRTPEKAKKWLWERGPEWRRAWLELNVSRCPGPLAWAVLHSAISPEPNETYSETLTKELIRIAGNTDSAGVLSLLAEQAPDKLAALNFDKLDFTEIDVDALLPLLPDQERARFAGAYALNLALNGDDFDLSTRWLRDHLDDDHERDEAVTELVDEVIRRAPSQIAEQFRNQQLDLDLSQEAELVRQLSLLDFDAARAWTESLPAGIGKDRVTAFLGTQPWASDGERSAALDYLRENPNDPIMTDFVANLAGRSADPEDAVTIVEQFPIGSLAAQKGIAAMVGTLAKVDPMRASELLLSIPPGNRSDRAIDELLQAIPDDLVGSLYWSLQLESPERRAELTKKYGVAIYHQDREAFDEVMGESGLSDEEKRDLYIEATARREK